MRSPKWWCVLVILICGATAPVAFGQSAKPSDDATQSKSTGKAATEEEVQQLRREVAELKAQIQRLVEVSAVAQGGAAHLVETNAVAASVPAPSSPAAIPAADAPDANASSPSATAADIDALQKEIDVLQKKASDAPGITAGWNGEHFFLKSADGNFTVMPVGYVDAQYTFYRGDGAPADTFAITRARFGVQGNYGSQLDYAFLFETASALTIRDAYLDFKPWSAFKIMGGQYKVPFSQEVGTNDTAVEFYNRSIISVLYPDAGGSFRAPGVDVHGDLFQGRMQYWAGIFNGQGLLTAGTTNEPEVVGRMRFSPWLKSDNAMLKGLSFGGSIEHSRSKGLANEQSFSGLLNDGTYNFFPQFRINGGIERYNGFFAFLKGPLGIRGEYAQLLQKRTNIGALAPGGVAFNTIPGVVGKGAYVSATYLLTGEREPENAIPRVKHPVIGPNSPGESGGPGWGAWALKIRYAWLEGKAGGATCDATTIPACPITPDIVPPYSDHTDQLTAGFNWYLNYWVLVKSDFNFNQLKNPSVQGILPRNYFVFVEGIQFRF
ncbi:MAG: porin [Candidatus Acidiferrales bacterium]|jgi:phosphate-selective porin